MRYRLDPRFVEAYYELAQADLAQHDWSAAYASLEKAIDLDPRALDARLDRGRLYLAARQFGNAEAEANYILKQQPRRRWRLPTPWRGTDRRAESDNALAAFAKLTSYGRMTPMLI